jgi:hypothetical protein
LFVFSLFLSINAISSSLICLSLYTSIHPGQTGVMRGRQVTYVVLYADQVMEVMLHKQDKLSGSWHAAHMGNLSHAQWLRGGFHRPVNYRLPTW